MTTRTITPEGRAIAARLKAIWNAKKRVLDMTQTDLAVAMGFRTQATVSQHMNEHLAINFETVLRYARVLKVDPEEIDPRLTGLTLDPSVSVRASVIKVPVLARISGKAPGSNEAVEIVSRMDSQIYAVSVDVAGFEPYAEQGSFLIVSTSEEPVPGDKVFIRLTEEKGSAHLIMRYVMTDYDSRQVILHNLTDGETMQIPLDQIEMFDPILTVEAPKVTRPARIRPSNPRKLASG